jgi:membrane-bound lytic murein transglycosylase D
VRWLWAAALLFAASAGWAADDLLPQPPELQPDVDFWIRVYSEVSTDEGFIHDQRVLAVVYEKVSFAPGSTPRDRQAQVDAVREKYQQLLRYFAAGGVPRDASEQRVHDLWPAGTTAARFATAVDDVRFQLGQSDRFRAGLERAGRWQSHIAETIARAGLPPELASLPHVESSFDPEAYSKVGAAGLWQFMRSTGRRFLRIDNSVDERMDPFRATEAAAQLLSYNFRALGTWPLAITAYNHGAEGTRRARDRMGTTDIVRILREYNSPLFGFASRNFYVSFLAAHTIDSNPHKYFGSLQLQSVARYQETELGASAGIANIERATGVARALLRPLNPALRDPVWSGARPVPAGYKLRLPAGGTSWTRELLAARLGTVAEPTPVVAAASGPVYVVQRGDTLESIARSNGVTLRTLLALNTLRNQNYVYEGQHLVIASGGAQPEPGVSMVSASPASPAIAAAVGEARAEQASAARVAVARPAQPLSITQAADQGPALLPGDTGTESAESVDLGVGDNDTIRIAAAETLGHYADWLGLTARRLRALNGLTARTPLLIGGRLKLDFSKTDHTQFEQRRRDYHQRLQAEYFAANRIVGTDVYLTQRGDSLWSVTKKNARLPVWLLQQYNPDVDFSALRPGTQIVLPRVEALPDV